MNINKGQALVEFVIILPILFIILFGIIDYGRIIYEKEKLENVISDIIYMIKSNKDLNEIKEIYDNYHISYSYEKDYINIIISKDINIIAPGLSLMLDNPYKIESKRVIMKSSDYNE